MDEIEGPFEPVQNMTTPAEPMASPEFVSLDPLVRKLWIGEALLTAFFLTLFLGGPATFVLFKKLPKSPVPYWILPIALFLIASIPRILLINAHYRRWKYRVQKDEVAVQYGVITQVNKTIPRGRIQHVDVQSGVIQRSLNLASVTIQTAGVSSSVTIPGVNKHTAEAIRRELMESSK